MEVKRVDMYIIKMKLLQPFTTSFGTVYERRVLLTRITGEGGEEGWGESVAGQGPWYSYETVETDFLIARKYLAPILVGHDLEDPEDFTVIASRIRGYHMAKAMFEEALIDLYTRLRGISIAEYLGGKKDEVKVGVSIGIKPSIDQLLEDISKRLDEGYERIKIKIKPGWDIEPIRKIRETFGDILLQVDANAAYGRSDIHKLVELDNYRLLMVEQPFHYDEFILHRVAARKLSTPLCLDESVKSAHDAVLAAQIGAADIINIKPGRVGGPLESKRILDAAPLLGMGVWIGGMLETGIGRSFLVALAAHPSVNYHSDISASDRYWERDIVDPPWTLNPGSTLSVPKKPGIGVEVDRERIEREAVEVWSLTL